MTICCYYNSPFYLLSEILKIKIIDIYVGVKLGHLTLKKEVGMKFETRNLFLSSGVINIIK